MARDREAVLGPEDRETVRRALADAIAWIEAGNGDPAEAGIYKALLDRLIHLALTGGQG